jgi:hypothetical protein
MVYNGGVKDISAGVGAKDVGGEGHVLLRIRGRSGGLLSGRVQMPQFRIDSRLPL